MAHSGEARPDGMYIADTDTAGQELQSLSPTQVAKSYLGEAPKPSSESQCRWMFGWPVCAKLLITQDCLPRGLH